MDAKMLDQRLYEATASGWEFVIRINRRECRMEARLDNPTAGMMVWHCGCSAEDVADRVFKGIEKCRGRDE